MVNANLTAQQDLIALGEGIVVLRNPKVWNASNYVANRAEFVNRLDRVGFDAAKAATKRLSAFNVRQLTTGNVSPSDADALENIAKTVYDVLSHEALHVTLIATDHVPPAELLDLERRMGRPLEPHQRALLSDLMTCLKAHLARPAIVMAWALGYDIVRWWVHSEPTRLAAFNAQFRQGSIVVYTDLFSVGERVFLDTCKNAQNALNGFNENTLNALIHLLNDRNRFAHANFSEASINRANAYIEKIVETVTSPPFA